MSEELWTPVPAYRGRGVETPHYPRPSPGLCFLQPCLSAGSACSQGSAWQKQDESSLLGSFPPFFVKNNLQKFKISKQLPGSRTPC